MAGKSYPTAPCSVCGRQIRVAKNGTIGPHGPGYYYCKGYGKPPAPARSESES